MQLRTHGKWYLCWQGCEWQIYGGMNFHSEEGDRLYTVLTLHCVPGLACVMLLIADKRPRILTAALRMREIVSIQP